MGQDPEEAQGTSASRIRRGHPTARSPGSRRVRRCPGAGTAVSVVPSCTPKPSGRGAVRPEAGPGLRLGRGRHRGHRDRAEGARGAGAPDRGKRGLRELCHESPGTGDASRGDPAAGGGLRTAPGRGAPARAGPGADANPPARGSADRRRRCPRSRRRPRRCCPCRSARGCARRGSCHSGPRPRPCRSRTGGG